MTEHERNEYIAQAERVIADSDAVLVRAARVLGLCESKGCNDKAVYMGRCIVHTEQTLNA